VAGVIHKASIIAVAVSYCSMFVIFSGENDDQRLARQLSRFAKCELLVPGVATVRQGRHYWGDVTAFSSTLSSKFISTSVILPSVSRHSPRTERAPADLRGTRLSTSTRVTPHKHEARAELSTAVRFASSAH